MRRSRVRSPSSPPIILDPLKPASCGLLHALSRSRAPILARSGEPQGHPRSGSGHPRGTLAGRANPMGFRTLVAKTSAGRPRGPAGATLARPTNRLPWPAQGEVLWSCPGFGRIRARDSSDFRCDFGLRLAFGVTPFKFDRRDATEPECAGAGCTNLRCSEHRQRASPWSRSCVARAARIRGCEEASAIALS